MNALLERFREQKVGVGIFLMLILFPVAAIIFLPPPDKLAIDPKTSCLIGSLERHRIILIDTTDPLETTQRDIVLDAIEGEAEHAATYEKLTIASIDDKRPFEPHILFSGCAPKRRSEGPSENPNLLNRSWLLQFHDPILTAVMPALQLQGQHETPLIESVFGLARRPDFGNAVPHRRLVIVSDMLQNTKDLYSQYRDGLDFTVFAKKPQAFQSVPDLTGVEVVNRYLDRRVKRCLQGMSQRLFWETYFSHARTSIRFDNWPWPKPDGVLEDRCRGAEPHHVVRPHKRHKKRHRHILQRTDAI